MAEGKSAVSPTLPSTVLEREAAEALRAVMKRRRFTYKLLSRALEAYGAYLAPTTLSNRVNRGKFPASFFIQCMYAMGLRDVRVSLSGMTEEELAELQRVGEQRKRKKRKPPARKTAKKRRS